MHRHLQEWTKMKPAQVCGAWNSHKLSPILKACDTYLFCCNFSYGLKWMFWGRVYVGKSYLSKKIFWQIICFDWSHGDMWSCLPGKVSCDKDFIKCQLESCWHDRKKLCLYGAKIFLCTEMSPVKKRDLGTWRDLACELVEMFFFANRDKSFQSTSPEHL